jgi:hypothetical protein
MSVGARCPPTHGVPRCRSIKEFSPIESRRSRSEMGVSLRLIGAASRKRLASPFPALLMVCSQMMNRKIARGATPTASKMKKTCTCSSVLAAGPLIQANRKATAGESTARHVRPARICSRGVNRYPGGLSLRKAQPTNAENMGRRPKKACRQRNGRDNRAGRRSPRKP